MSENILLQPYDLNGLMLKNKLIMSAMTRSRAGKGLVPYGIHVKYYRQRSSAALIVTEGSQVSPQGVGYVNTPGIYNKEQTDAWRKVTDAVHEEGSHIFIQLWHVGRISHPDFHGGKLPVAPSAIKPEGLIMTYEGRKQMVIPRALETEEIPGIVNDFKKASENALEAGFDGVEIHAANCYLPHQFLWDGSNKRTDRYGGSIENRARFLFEIIEAVNKVWDSRRIGVKLSPSNIRYGMDDSNPVKTMDYVINKMNDYKLAYLDLAEPLTPLEELPEKYLRDVAAHYRKIYHGTIITNGNYDPESAQIALESGIADLVAFGRFFLANPDLPRRIELGGPYNQPDRSTFYGGSEKGYTDYPFLD